MCGINGILCLNGGSSTWQAEELTESIKAMNDALAHRGPDGEGIYVNGPIGLGHRRLSILDLSENGSQPMFNEDRSIAIVFNGEIYNYLELMPDLVKQGHIFKSKTDTEVIIHAYEEYGVDCVKRFNGMWAFVIYDFKKHTLFASRDRLGVKPFYYFYDNSRFVFSSEIKSILKHNKVTDAHLGKVYDYLAYGYKTNNGDTFFKGICELKSAHNLVIKNAKFIFSKYWDIADVDATRYSADLEHATHDFMSLFTDAIKLRFRSDVPVAMLVSGGLDSTAITRVIDTLIEDGSLNCSEVTAYSAVFPGYALNEEAVVKEFIKTCRHIRFEPVYPDSKALLGSICDIAYGLGEPVFSATSFAHFLLMKEISRTGVKVVLNGQGSDEAFCGYGNYIVGYFLLDVLKSRPADFAREVRAISQRMGFSYSYIATQIVKALLPRRKASYLRAKYQERTLDTLDADFIGNNITYFDAGNRASVSQGSLDNYLKLNLTDYAFTQILHYEDHSSMQSSVEIRSPFIDYRLMEFAFRLPTRYKISSGVTKKIIREAFKGMLPDSVIYGQKIGFSTPFSQWLQEKDFNDFVMATLTSQSFNSRSIWNKKEVLRKFSDVSRNPRFPYWRVLNLELWASSYGITNL